MNQEVIVGTVGRPHGLHGEVLVRPRTDSVELRFADGAVVSAAGRELVVASHSLMQGRLVVRFEGVADRTGAEALRGSDLWAPADGLDLAEDEFSDTDLVGLRVEDRDGRELGEVSGVEHPPAHDLLVVRTENGDRLVPFVAELVPSIDLAAGLVVVNPIPGLLSDLDEPDETPVSVDLEDSSEGVAKDAN